MKYVPVKSVCVGKTKPMWMSFKAMKAVKHRHNVYRKYKDHSHPACRNADRQASVAVRNSRRHFERMLSLNIKEDKKSFYSYARSKTKTKVQAGPLRDDHGQEVSHPGAMADIFDKQFLANRTNGCAYATVLRLSSVCL